ncbi:MAG TPA: sulfite exporter TauE/SafE family protein, partial [Candidatus Limnocylindria bacterium]
AYGTAALLTAATVGIGLLMAPAMIAGSVIGKRIVDRLPERVFVAIIEVVLVGAGLVFLVGG